MACRRLSYAVSDSGRCPLAARAFATLALRPGNRVRPHSRLELLAKELVEAFLAIALDRVSPLQLVRLGEQPIERDIEGHLLHDLERTAETESIDHRDRRLREETQEPVAPIVRDALVAVSSGLVVANVFEILLQVLTGAEAVAGTGDDED